ncbi:hypothetical protein GOP47_0029830 [Adiantum capillus-veneris]|nr:hypothetical protein GOP47_0029830 [Adiantum capillus-veneris]
MREEGEISEVNKEGRKEELTKAMKEELEAKMKAIIEPMEASRNRWVEVVKRNLKEEAKEDAQRKELLIVHASLPPEIPREV